MLILQMGVNSNDIVSNGSIYLYCTLYKYEVYHNFLNNVEFDIHHEIINIY